MDNFAAVSHGILRTGPQNLAKLTQRNVGPGYQCCAMQTSAHLFDSVRLVVHELFQSMVANGLQASLSEIDVICM